MEEVAQGVEEVALAGACALCGTRARRWEGAGGSREHAMQRIRTVIRRGMIGA